MKMEKEISGTGFAFFEPANASAKSGTGRGLRNNVIQLLSKILNESRGLMIRDLASCTMLSSGDTAFQITDGRLAFARSDQSKIPSCRGGKIFRSIPTSGRNVCGKLIRGSRAEIGG